MNDTTEEYESSCACLCFEVDYSYKYMFKTTLQIAEMLN